MQQKYYMQEKRNNCFVLLNVYFKNKLELVKQAMLQRNALGDFTYLYITLPRFILVWAIHYNLPKRITGQPFTYARKNCGISEVNSLRLIIMCKDKTVFNFNWWTFGTQVGSMFRESTGKRIYLLVYAFCFISGVFGFGTPWS